MNYSEWLMYLGLYNYSLLFIVTQGSKFPFQIFKRRFQTLLKLQPTTRFHRGSMLNLIWVFLSLRPLRPYGFYHLPTPFVAIAIRLSHLHSKYNYVGICWECWLLPVLGMVLLQLHDIHVDKLEGQQMKLPATLFVFRLCFVFKEERIYSKQSFFLLCFQFPCHS